ncbi:MAG: hypothetical protein JSU63_07085 [Phycisphaerales bacterium]|nr:MAG: hypothetical protein JSU63_07085 [Phycisphaerales bacterium]
MTGTLAFLVLGFIELAGPQRQILMLPLCLSIAVVYKTTRCEKLSDVPVAALVLWGTIVLGMYAVGVGLWLLYLILV